MASGLGRRAGLGGRGAPGLRRADDPARRPAAAARRGAAPPGARPPPRGPLCAAATAARTPEAGLQQGLFTARATALSWLSKALPEEYAALFAARVAELAIPPLRRHIASRDVFDSIEQAVAQDRLQVTACLEATALLELPDDTFRAAVADDVREQNAGTPGSATPWACAAGTRARPSLRAHGRPRPRLLGHRAGPLPVDLAELPRQEAMQIINARRFFCAVQQRRLDPPTGPSATP
ncbi:hypothetical protein ACW23B_28690 [Streptomyces albidoflavus]